MIGTVSGVQSAASSTELELLTSEGTISVHVSELADHRSARRVEQALRRCVSLGVERSPDGWTCIVRGVGHRHPVDLRISISTALGLIERGLPTVVRLP